MLTFILVPFLLAMFLAINMGASGTAPSFSPAYGAGLVQKHQISMLFGLMVLFGAIFSGKQVSITMGQGILPQDFFTLEVTSAILFAIGLSLLVANLLGVPQSTTQASVLAIAGGAVAFSKLNTQKLFFEIIPLWFILPCVAFFIVWILGKLIIRPLRRAVRETSYKTFVHDHPAMKYLVLGGCLYVAYSIGANNVAHAAGPVTSMAIKELGIQTNSNNFTVVMILSVLIAAPCFAIGSELMGYKGLRNTGKEIIAIGPLSGTLISLVTATLLLSASITKGIPTSLVQLNTAAFLAHSVNKIGWRATFRKPKVRQFFIVWGITPLFAFFFAMGLVYLVSQYP